MDSQKRLLITMAACFALTTLWMFLFPPKQPEQPQQQPPAVAQTQASAPKPAPTAPTPSAPVAPNAAPLAARSVTVALPTTAYQFSNEGAGLSQAMLLGDKMREQGAVTVSEGFGRLVGKGAPPPPQMNLAQPVTGAPLPLGLTIDGAAPLEGTLRYELAQSPEAVRFHGSQNGWDVQKELTFGSGPYQLGYDVTLRNTSDQAREGELAIHYPRAIKPEDEQKPSFFGGVGNLSYGACIVDAKAQKMGPSDKPPEEHKGKINAFGVDQQYFLSAVYPLDGAFEGRCVVSGTPTAREAVAYLPFKLGPGQSMTRHFGVYLGAKDHTKLGDLSVAIAGAHHVDPKLGPQLDAFIDFGFFAFFAKILLGVMVFVHGVVGNWGVAIILLTVLVKVLLTPLTHKGLMSQEAMKRVQPKVEAIKKKYPEDKERVQIETMRLYQQEKVNPFSGCITMLIQLPIWWALYSTLRNSFELYREPFFAPLWTDLTFKDPTYVIPVLLGVSQILTMKLQPQTLDAQQAKIMTYVMPVFFTFIMLNYPLGLTLYIFTNNVLTVAQQYALKRWMGRGGGGATQPAGRELAIGKRK
jgi:YidC/Oxa1 family membrane protein insertase